MNKFVIGLIAGLALTGSACADEVFPERPITLVVGFSTGGSTDVVARIVAQKAAELLGKPIIVENKSGAGGVIASGYVAKSRADGYTVLFGTSALPIGSSLYKKLPNDPAKALVPVTLVAEVPMVLVVHPSIKATTAREFTNLIKQNPGKYHYGSAGIGSALHMAVELLKYQEGLDASHIPFRGAAPAMQALIAGDVQFMIDGVSTVAPMVKLGRMNALAVTSARRSSALPELPTMREAGFPEYETGLWNMILVPQGTPTSVITKLNTTFQLAIRDREVQDRFRKLGIEAIEGSDPAKASQYLQKETRRWSEVIAAGNIQPE